MIHIKHFLRSFGNIATFTAGRSVGLRPPSRSYAKFEAFEPIEQSGFRRGEGKTANLWPIRLRKTKVRQAPRPHGRLEFSSPSGAKTVFRAHGRIRPSLRRSPVRPVSRARPDSNAAGRRGGHRQPVGEPRPIGERRSSFSRKGIRVTLDANADPLAQSKLALTRRGGSRHLLRRSP